MEQHTQISAGDLQIDLRGHRVMVGDREVVLTSKEFDLLCHLAEHPGWAWSQRQLLESVWGYDFGDLHVVVVHLANLRRKLGEVSSAPRFIHTVRGVGYRFEAWSAREPSDEAKPVPFARRGLPPQSDALVGRLPELEALRGALKAAVEGTGQLVTVGGDVGIGKTRLAEELAKEATAQGVPVTWGLCREKGAAPWEPWPEVVRTCLSLPGIVPTAGTAQQLLLGWSGERVAAMAGADTPDQTRERVIQEIGLALAGAASRYALVVILEDVHWADASSLLCLQHLSRVARSRRWLLLVTYRDFEVARSPLLGDVIASAARTGGQTLLLRPLAEADVAGLVAQSTGEAPTNALVDAVYQITEGNPFFVRELLRLLALREGDVAIVSELPRQEGVRQVIGRRISILSSDCIRLLELAAVIGLRFSVLLAERASGLPADRCATVLDEAESSQVLRAVGAGTFVFGHQLVRDVVYLGLSATRRAMLHARVGDAIEDLWSADIEVHAAELAHHFSSAGDVRSVAKAFSYAILAGHVASSRYAWEEAAQWLERALELQETYPGCSPSAPALAALHEDLGDAQVAGGHIDQAVEAFENALRVCPDASLPDAGRRYRKVGGALVLTPQVARATLAYLEAERVMGEPTPDRPCAWWEEWLSVELERCWGHYYAAEFDGLLELAERIRPFVDAHGSSAHRGAFYNCLWVGAEGVSRYVTSEQGLEYALASAEAYRSAGSLRDRCEGEWVAGLAFLFLPGHPVEAETHLRRFLQLSQELGDITAQLEALWGLAKWHRWHGHVERVRELAERGLALNSGKNIACYTPSAQGNLAWVAYRAGELERARELASEALAAIERDEEHAFAYQWLMRWPLIGVGLASGELDETMIHARALLQPNQQAMPADLEETMRRFLDEETAGDRSVRQTREEMLVLAEASGYL